MSKKLSTLPKTDTGQPQCPNCGSTNFKPKRSLKGKILGGFLFAPKSRAGCVGCGKVYKRK